MFQARYLVRFDDLCPTMNWVLWARIESVLVQHQIAPLLAVVPDNRDKKLVVGPAKPDFWNEVRKWQARSWTIGLHGYQHLYVTKHSGIVGIQPRSEFAGLPPEAQEEKLRRGIEILRSEGIEPQMWIAPAHSFDLTTVESIKKFGITTISDGLAIAPHTDRNGTFWVPQQLWRFRRRPFGTWTVCFHHNHWSDKQFDQFQRDIEQYHPSIASFASIKSSYCDRHHTISDSFYSIAHSTVLSLRANLGSSA
jgi:predicted deacetylase